MSKLISLIALTIMSAPISSAAPVAASGSVQAAFGASDLIGGWRGPPQDVPVDTVTMHFSESLTYYDTGGAMRAEAVVSMSGEVDGITVNAADTRMTLTIGGTWSFDGQAITTHAREVTVTPVEDRPELREAAGMIRAMYLAMPNVTVAVERWDGAVLTVREPITGETFEMRQIG